MDDYHEANTQARATVERLAQLLGDGDHIAVYPVCAEGELPYCTVEDKGGKVTRWQWRADHWALVPEPRESLDAEFVGGDGG